MYGKTVLIAMAAAAAADSMSPYATTMATMPHGNTTVVTTTKVVSQYTTYCPEPTTFEFNQKTYTVEEACTFTITDCPCTVVETSTCPTSMPTVVPTSKAMPPAPPMSSAMPPAPMPQPPAPQPAPPAPQPAPPAPMPAPPANSTIPPVSGGVAAQAPFGLAAVAAFVGYVAL